MIAILMMGLAGMILVTGVLVGHALKTHVYDIRDRRLAQQHHEVRLREANCSSSRSVVRTRGCSDGHT
jgi:hypothetical protein